jgi:uncharacterized repeat protein (TIGR03803 family)
MSRNKTLENLSKALIVMAMAVLALAPGAWAQGQFKALYRFTDGADGNGPWAGLIADSSGNLYGATIFGGNLSNACVDRGCGVVFELTPKGDGTWRETVLYTFCPVTNCADGSNPVATLTFDEAGNLYGTTLAGGGAATCVYQGEGGCGVVFKLTPHPDGSWTESVLYNFCSLTNCPDGLEGVSTLVIDPAGNLYGTTNSGGSSKSCCGVVFKLSPNVDGSWSESVLHSFNGRADGYGPESGLIFDAAGNLYGTTAGGGYPKYCKGGGCGVVFEISPNGSETILHRFSGKDGSNPFASLTFDQAGNLYGTTEFGGGDLSQCGGSGCGVVFELVANKNGSWTEKILRRFNGGPGGGVPTGRLVFDPAGNLYGTATQGGNLNDCSIGCGVVFKLTPNSEGGWNETTLYRFANQPGVNPVAGLTFDAAGNIYGTTVGNDGPNFGSVFEITP